MTPHSDVRSYATQALLARFIYVEFLPEAA